MNELVQENLNQVNIDRISSYIRNLRFKSVALGGVDRGSVLASIQEIYHMFSDVYDDLIGQLSVQKGLVNALKEKQAPLEQEITQLKAEKESMAITIRQQTENSDRIAAAEDRYRQQAAKDSLEIDTLRQKVQSLEFELASIQKKHQRELELAKAGATDQGEILEEIYLDARRSRNAMLEQAQKTADELLRKTEQEAAEKRAAAQQAIEAMQSTANQELAAKQAEAEQAAAAARSAAEQLVAEKQIAAQQLIAEAEEEAQQIRQRMEAANLESQQQLQQRQEEAEQVCRDAKAEAKQIIDAARTTYLQERKKYDAMRMQLSALRAKTVQDIQVDIANLNELVFGMTGRGFATDANNAAELTNLDSGNDLQKDVQPDEVPLNIGAEPL